MTQPTLRDAARALRNQTRPNARRKLQPRKRQSVLVARRLDRTPLWKRVLGLAHGASAFVSATACGMAAAAIVMAWNDSAIASVNAAYIAQPASAPVVLATQIRDLDFDGRADVASPTAGFLRGEDHYGKGAFGASRDGGRRKHAGADYVVLPGGAVHAPITGEVTRIGEAYTRNSGLHFVEIHDAHLNLTARVFYVAPGVAIGDELAAGDSIGAAQDLSGRYPAGITNHVHVEVRNAFGEELDPSRLLPMPLYQVAQTPQAARGATTVR